MAKLGFGVLDLKSMLSVQGCPSPRDWDTFPALGVFPAGSTSRVHIPWAVPALGAFPSPQGQQRGVGGWEVCAQGASPAQKAVMWLHLGLCCCHLLLRGQTL